MAASQQRFADPATERAFLRAERSERGGAIRALIVLAALTLISYILINPMHLPRDGVVAYSAAAGTLILLMAGFFALTRTDIYLDRPWLDLPVFVLLAAAMTWLALVLAGLAAYTGFPAHVMAMVQMAILVVFASVGFAGTFRLFLLWSFALFALFAAWLFTRDNVSEISRVYTLTNFSTFFVFALYFNWDTERRARKVFAANQALEAERAKTEALLYNVLPQEVAARLKAGEAVADAFSDVTVVFVDLVDFSRLAKRLSPGHLVELLNGVFSAADRCAERHGLEKVKTIGDAYLAVAGGMASRDAGSRAAIAFSADLIEELGGMANERGLPLQARIGVHTGPVVGGVIGSHRLAYDYWGDTMNIASRLQGAAPPNGIAVSEATYFQTQALLAYEARALVLKGIGETDVYVASLSRA
ncbi:MAG: adenylate/guanylate cyclase domain-containing protein [Sphingosinicella sp.]|uniref:adenylate/guanylate cyclase domain-containing protein n=1 Tax=Sphingosinicella sp. TaxID=1917971 RepID=UPI00403801A6